MTEIQSVLSRRLGRAVGKPRFKSRKDNCQSFRLTSNGFAIRDTGRLYIAKVGEVRVRWSRDLPSAPSSVTIIREPDGHYYASFVVERDPQPLPETDRETGVDLGISRLATCADTDGTRADVSNPKHQQRNQRKLARAISDAGWGQFVRTIAEKAEYYGRAVHTVNRWLPSSKTCSACHYLADAMPLRIRDWTCPGCGAAHDRDFNAARIILAAGRAERLNACGARVSPPSHEGALGDEAGSSGKPRESTIPVAA